MQSGVKHHDRSYRSLEDMKQMAEKEVPGLRRQGKAFIIALPRRGKQKQVIPEELILNLLDALKLSLGAGEGVAVPDDDLSGPRLFDKQHQATNYGRKLKDELAARDSSIGELSVSTPSVEHDADGKPVGPFALALSKK